MAPLPKDVSEAVEEPSNKIAPSHLPSEEVIPKTGVEVMPPEDRQGGRYYTMSDLRNGNVVKNVTRASARRLWHYAITQFNEIANKIDQIEIQWEGNYGLILHHKQGKTDLLDLIQRTPQGYRFFFGVTLDGIHGPWKVFAEEEDDKSQG